MRQALFFSFLSYEVSRPPVQRLDTRYGRISALAPPPRYCPATGPSFDPLRARARFANASDQPAKWGNSLAKLRSYCSHSVSAAEEDWRPCTSPTSAKLRFTGRTLQLEKRETGETNQPNLRRKLRRKRSRRLQNPDARGRRQCTTRSRRFTSPSRPVPIYACCFIFFFSPSANPNPCRAHPAKLLAQTRTPSVHLICPGPTAARTFVPRVPAAPAARTGNVRCMRMRNVRCALRGAAGG